MRNLKCTLTFVILDSTILESLVHTLEKLAESGLIDFREEPYQIFLGTELALQCPDQARVLLGKEYLVAFVSLLDSLLQEL